jgi:hypothetical protein
MKNFTLILMIVLALMFSSNKAFAADDWTKGLNSLGSQISSGLTGLSQGKIGEVAAGVNNFMSTAPVLSSVYDFGRSVGSIPGLTAGINNFVSTAPILSSIYGLGKTYSSSYASGISGIGVSKISSPISGISSRLSASVNSGSRIADPGKGSWLPRTSTDTVGRIKRQSIVAGTYQPVTSQRWTPPVDASFLQK